MNRSSKNLSSPEVVIDCIVGALTGGFFITSIDSAENWSKYEAILMY